MTVELQPADKLPSSDVSEAFALKAQTLQCQLDCVSNLAGRASAMSSEEIQDEFIPSLVPMDWPRSDDLPSLALVEELGGSLLECFRPAQVHLLLIPLRPLVSTSNPNLRARAVRATHKVANTFSTQSYHHYYIPFLKHLSEGTGAQQASAVELHTYYYVSAPPFIQSTIITALETLHNESESPRVQTSFSTVTLPILIELAHKDVVRSFIIPIFAKLIENYLASARLLALRSISGIVERLDITEIPRFLGLLRDFARANFRHEARGELAHQLIKLCSLVSQADIKNEFLELYLLLRNDNAPFLREKVTSLLPDAAAYLSRDTLLRVTNNLSADPCVGVRTELALVLNAILSTQPTEDAHRFLPAICRLLDDPSPDMRLCAIQGLREIPSGLRIDPVLQQRLLSSFKGLLAGKTTPWWRVRQRAMELLAMLIPNFGAVLVDEQMTGVVLSSLHHYVSAVRLAAATTVAASANAAGPQWTKRTILPILLLLGRGESHVKRILYLKLVASIAHVLGPKIISQDKIIETILQLTSDPVPNVRLNVPKALMAIISVLPAPSEDIDMVRPALAKAANNLLGDTDADVVFQARLFFLAQPCL